MDHGLHPHVTNHRKLRVGKFEGSSTTPRCSQLHFSFTRSRSCRSTPRSAWLERSWTCDIFKGHESCCNLPNLAKYPEESSRFWDWCILMHRKILLWASPGISKSQEFHRILGFSFWPSKTSRITHKTSAKSGRTPTNLEKSYNRMF